MQGMPEPISLVIGREAVYTLDCMPVSHRADTETDKPLTLTLTRSGHLESPTNY